jgi:twitching motility protein PilT
MAQLDRLLGVMVSQRASALRLNEGAVAELEIGGASRPATRTPLTEPQILALVREITSADRLGELDAGSAVSFPYASEDGAFAVQVTRDNARLAVRITMDAGRERQRLNGMHRTADHAVPPPAAPAASVPAAPAPAAVARRDGVGASGDAIGSFDGCERAKAALDALLRLIVEKGASDLHLRCGEPPILRLHGEMQRLSHPPLEPEMLEQMLRSIMPERNRNEFTETNDTDYAYEITGVARFRANALKDRNGPAAVFRQIPATVVTVEQMGITAEVQRLCQLNKGLVLVTGPTGSGKSTTLCSLIDLVNRSRSDHVITIEDPIEFVHPNKKCIITQRQVGVHTGSFKSALRAALREDPDIILVGELRDLETVSIAIETAETGHLVFGTLHTTTAAGTIDRIIDQFPADRQAQIRVMLAESLRGVISQTLCKKVGGGRAAAREVLLSIPAVTNLIREGKTFQIPSVMQTSKRLGMVTLNDALLELVDSGQVEAAEAYSKAVEKTGFVASLKARGVDTSFADGELGAKPATSPAPAGKR